MASLTQLYTNLLVGGAVTTACFMSFGLAVALEANRNLTPRAWARPVRVIKNCLKRPYALRWMTWAMSLRYIDLLSGIPGTGTRREGWSGPTLRTNLDGIVLLRYHTLMFKVSLLATTLCMFMLLPLYYTAPCDSVQSGARVCDELKNNSDLEQLTIANLVPHIEYMREDNSTDGGDGGITNGTFVARSVVSRLVDLAIGNSTDANVNSTNVDRIFNDTLTDKFIRTFELQWIPDVTVRYMVYFFTVVLITIYTCHLLWHEWIECLALRRVYYLESEYYEERLDELDEIRTNTDPEDPFQQVRPPFLPHPEMRETIPNVSLHSALYKLPSNLCTNFEDNTNGEKSLLERQLEAAASFFDQCVPAQPGFTSSIAAVTIVPDARKLTRVWGRWYVLGNKMRRIRFLKQQIQHRKEMQRTGRKGLHDLFVVAPKCAAGYAIEKITEGIEAMKARGAHDHKENGNDDEEQQRQQQANGKDKTPVSDAKDLWTSTAGKGDDSSGVETPGNSDDSDIAPREKTLRTVSISDGIAGESVEMRVHSSVPGFLESGTTDRFEYTDFDPVTFAKWIGYSEETELDQVIDTLEIEQLSVFARETSQSASNPCVYGCAPESLRLASIEQLEDMLEEDWNAARDLNAELLLARAEMFRQSGGRKGDSILLSSETENDKTRGKTSTDKTNPTIPEGQSVNNEENVPAPSNVGQSSRQSNGLRQRGKRMNRAKSTRDKYGIAQELVRETNAATRTTDESGEEMKGCCHGTCLRGYVTREAAAAASITTNVLYKPTYCVVTFTCRQAAIAARQCLSDGKGKKAWKQIQSIPMYPLADGPPRNPFFCRGCCRPVDLSMTDTEKRTRKICSWIFYVSFCFLYTIPLTLIAQVLNPTWIAAQFPNNDQLNDPNGVFNRITGFAAGFVTSIFYSILPQIFKRLAFSEGTSSSKAKGEESAVRFYWYFMLVTAFAGASLLQMLLDSLLDGNVTDGAKDLVDRIAGSIVEVQSPVWANWIIVRTFTILPLNYLLQIMTFVMGWLRIHWLNRVVRGGGPGAPLPIRIYIDSGVVFMCTMSLAPASPLIAPIAALYYIMFIPILRWLLIFVYRPQYDGGGNMLPLIHEIIISSLMLGHVLLGTVLLLKQSFVFGSLIVLMPIPTYMFSVWTREKFERSYNDAGLWQTSKLDGLVSNGTEEDREKYRRWLVDCHKASYVPICLSGGEDFLTVQPASVISINQELIGKKFKSLSPKHGTTVAQKGAL